MARTVTSHAAAMKTPSVSFDLPAGSTVPRKMAGTMSLVPDNKSVRAFPDRCPRRPT